MGQIQRYFTTTEHDENIVLVGNSKIDYIQKRFLFTQANISTFYQIFRRIDTKGAGYIGLTDLFNFLDEELDGIVSPYLEYLFQLIDKEVDSKLSFSELLPAISLFCLYTKESIIAFVFQMLDSDHDNIISKRDLINFLNQKRNGKHTFYYNYLKSIEMQDIERPDKITLEQFNKLQQQVPFLCYPAFRLQTELRNKILGVKYWDQLYDRILKKENEENQQKYIEKKSEELKKQQQNKLEMKTEKFLNNRNKSNVSLPSIRKIHQRTNERRNSDTNMPQNQETADEIISQTFQLLKGANNQNKQKELKQLRCRSKSLVYIKINYKFTKEVVPRSNQNIKTLQSQQNIDIKGIKESRRSIFQAKAKVNGQKEILTSNNDSDDDQLSQQ